MASILLKNQSPAIPGSIQAPQTQPDPVAQANILVQQIMGSQNPTETFKQFIGSNPEAQNAVNLINQYGNGDPKTAFMNYAAAIGNQALAQQIMQRMGLN